MITIKIIARVLEEVERNWKPRHFGLSLLRLFRDHVSSRYPGSTFWDPAKITLRSASKSGTTSQTQLDIDIPGAGRAYHDVDIYPVNGQWLTIPLVPQAKGKLARDFDLFRPYKRGTRAKERANVLLEKNTLVAMFALSKHVH